MLTIYIPTYNRAKCLGLVVRSLIKEIDASEELQKKIKIKISDNYSSDETKSFLLEITRPYLEVLTRSENIGAIQNIADAINHCESSYLWILGDDDIPSRGILSRIIDFLDSNNPDLIYLKSAWVKNIFNAKILNIKSEAEFIKLDADELARKAGVKLTFISSFVFKTENLKFFEKTKDFEIVAKSNFPHLNFIGPLMMKNRSLYTFESTAITATGNTNFQYSLLNAFGIELPNVFGIIFLGNHKLINILNVNLLMGYLPKFIYSVKYKNAQALKSEIPWKSIESTLGNYFVFWIFVWPMKYLPRLMAFPLIVISRFIR